MTLDHADRTDFLSNVAVGLLRLSLRALLRGLIRLGGSLT